MFFGKILSNNQTYKFSADEAEETQGEVLSLTNVVLAPTSKDGASLYLKKDNQEFLIASLTKDRPQSLINVFISLLDEVSLVVKGNGTLHVTGFFEPEQAGDLALGEEDLDSEDDEEEVEVANKTTTVTAALKPTAAKAASPLQKAQSPLQKAQSPQQKPQAAGKPAQVFGKKPVQPEEEDDEDLDDEEFDEDELEDDEDLDDDLEDDEDEEAEEEPAAAAPQKHVKPDTQKPTYGGKPQGGFQNNRQGGHQGGHQGGKPFNKGGR